MIPEGVAEKFPVLLGGAALTRRYVENDLAEGYEGEVHYARDAFEGLKLMDIIMSAKRGEAPDTDSPEAIAAREKAAERKARHERPDDRGERKATEKPVEVPERSDVAADLAVPARRSGAPASSRASLSRTTPACSTSAHCSSGQWGLRGVRAGEGPSYEELVETEGRPRLRYWLDRLSTDGILAHAAVVYGYFPAVSEGDDVVVLTEPKTRCDPKRTVPVHFPAPAARPVPVHRRLHPVAGTAAETGQVDVLPFQLVTMGQPIADFANELFAGELLPRLPRGARHRRAAHRGARRVLA